MRLMRRLYSGLIFFFLLICILLVLNANLPDIPIGGGECVKTNRVSLQGTSVEEVKLGKFGEMMVSMLPDDLAFTVFIPSEEGFKNLLRLYSRNDSLTKETANDTFAILSRIMGFSAVPQHLRCRDLPLQKEMILDSVSGFKLHAWRASEGTFTVNTVKSKQVDIRKGETIVHVMHGVIMDAEFRQSV